MRILLLSVLLGVLFLVFAGNASADGSEEPELIVETDSDIYFKGDPVKVFVTLSNPTPTPFVLHFATNCTTNYMIKGHYDYLDHKKCVGPRTYLSIPAKSKRTWVFIHTYKDYSFKAGRKYDVVGEIRGFGSFSVKGYDGYMGRNPKTGEPVPVAPKRLPVFRVGKDLAARVDQGS